MTENFLYFIWQQQYFNKERLISISGEAIDITFPGYLNHDAGPDFNNANISVDNMKWAGSIEIHVKSSDWLRHQHQKDKAYDNVILHVVWEYDKKILRTDGTEIPTLELKNRVDPQLLEKSNQLVSNVGSISCANQLTEVDDLIKLTMMDRVLMQRLERKALEVMSIYGSTNNNWEECAYQLLCKNMGFKINAQPFEQLANSLPINTVRKHANSQLQIEALLFGQAGFLDKIENDYQQELGYEYRFLAHKYQLHNRKLNVHQWKFARLRPANFPTVRLAQLSVIIKSTSNLFSSLVEVSSYSEAKKLLKVELSGFWKNHYQFGDEKVSKVSSIGKSSIENIIINTITPLLVAYGKSIDNQVFVDRAVNLLESIPAENNNITRKWGELGERSTTAFTSQAQIELYNNYCKRKKCLQCEIGIRTLKTPLKN